MNRSASVLVEQLPEILECAAVGQHWQGGIRVVLFVVLRDQLKLDDALQERIRRLLRDNASPRHVPKKILQASELPRTRNGKLAEVAIRNVIHGEPVKNLSALANPRSLDQFRGLKQLET